MLLESKLLKTNQFNKKNYFKFLNSFKKLGYKFVNFRNIKQKKNVILRHDVDFSIDLAKKIAIWDKNLNISSHFFFQYDSPFYNLLTGKNIDNLKFIKKLNHKLGFHITIKKESEIKKELSLFSKLLAVHNIKFDNIFSIHKVGSKKQKINVSKYKNFYKNKSLKIYYADSGGLFRFGNPLKDKEIVLNKSTFQLNLHPVWWVSNKNTSKKKKIEATKRLVLNILNDELGSYKLL